MTGTLAEYMACDPVLIAYSVKRSKTSKRPIWTRIGQAYPHEVGAGLTVVLDAMPLDGRIVLLELGDADDREFISAADMVRVVPNAKPKRSPKPAGQK